MLLLGYDLECTGLDVNQDRIIELGAVVWDTEAHSPVEMLNVLVKPEPTTELSDEIIELTGITQKAMDTYGTSTARALERLDELFTKHAPQYVLAHNGRGYDFPLLKAEFKRCGLTTSFAGSPVLDTRDDVPYPARIKTRSLPHLAAEHGFLNPFPHRAVFDVLTMFKVLSFYPFDEVLAYSQVPWLVVKAEVSYDQRELAKARRYNWEKIGEKTYSKSWVKRLKQTEFERERTEAPFRVTILEGV